MELSVYNWFTEGFDTGDLQETKALLDSVIPVNLRLRRAKLLVWLFHPP